jgi:hypothetical protein
MSNVVNFNARRQFDQAVNDGAPALAPAPISPLAQELPRE